MTDFDPNTDDQGVPRRYTAEYHFAGCLPETDVDNWDTPREAWNGLIERLNEWDGMWERVPAHSDKHPTGFTYDKSDFHRLLEGMAASNQPGQVTDSTGMIYSVEDTHVNTCGDPTCGRTFPDLYPAGRCPYEYQHGVMSRTVGAR